MRVNYGSVSYLTTGDEERLVCRTAGNTTDGLCVHWRKKKKKKVVRHVQLWFLPSLRMSIFFVFITADMSNPHSSSKTLKITKKVYIFAKAVECFKFILIVEH